MIKLNNKGQSLVLFILLIPIILGVMALVIDMGHITTKKNDIENVIELAIDNTLDTSNKDNLLDNSLNSKINSIEVLLNYNLKDCHNSVNLKKDKILIKTNTYVDGIFSKLFGFKGFKIESEYLGYIKENKIIKEKIK